MGISVHPTAEERIATTADKTAVQPKQISEMVWKESKLNKGSCIIDFPHRSIAKISHLVTHFMKISGINSFPFNVEKSQFLALALIVKESQPDQLLTEDAHFEKKKGL